MADAKLRAGLRLIPDSGASRVMETATSAPARSPVRGASRGRRAVVVRTIVIITKAIASSARNATDIPRGPGSVAT